MFDFMMRRTDELCRPAQSHSRVQSGRPLTTTRPGSQTIIIIVDHHHLSNTPADFHSGRPMSIDHVIAWAMPPHLVLRNGFGPWFACRDFRSAACSGKPAGGRAGRQPPTPAVSPASHSATGATM